MIYPTSNALPSTTAILQALHARCAALTWQGQPAFDRVELFDLVELEQLMGRLVLNQSRFCVFIYAGEDFTTERRGIDLHVRRKLDVACLIGDRVLKDRVEAFLGNATTPGAYELNRLVVGAITGNLLDNPQGAFCVPVHSESLVIQSDAGKMPGRAAIELDLEIIGGEVKSTIGPGPIF